jgi:hypothetical protein
MTHPWHNMVSQFFFFAGLFALVFIAIASSSEELRFKVKPVQEARHAPGLHSSAE